MPDGQARVVEVFGRIPVHAQAFHHRPRGLVGLHREGHDLIKVQTFEPHSKRTLSRLGRNAEAKAAFSSVQGAKADTAKFWLLFLDLKGA